MTKIFLVTDSLKTNGWGEFASSTAKILAKNNNFRVFIISKTSHNRNFSKNIKVLRLFNNIFIDALLINTYNFLFKPKVVHFCSEKVFGICKFYNHKKIILTIHGTYGFLFKKRYSRLIEKISVVTYDSRFTEERFKSLFKEKKSYLVYPLSNFYIENEENEFVKKKRKYILFIGNSKKRKGLNLVLKSFEKISKKFNNVKLALVGNFSDEHKKVIRNKPLIEIYCGISNDKLIDLISSSIVNVLPSINAQIENQLHFEGFGLVHIESNIFGTPTIGTNECGNTDIIKNNFNGFLINQNNVNELSKSLYKIIDRHNKDDYSLNNNSIQIKNTFNSIDFNKKIINAYGI